MRRLSQFSLDDNEIEKLKLPYLDIISVAIIQFLLSMPILCYGVYVMVLVEVYAYDLKIALWTAVSFVGSFKITNPWARSYCKHLDNIRHKVHKRNVIITVIVLWFTLISAVITKSPYWQILLYGNFGGTLTSVICMHLKYSTLEIFKDRPQLFDTLEQIVKPLCLIFVPHFILHLTVTYGIYNSQLIPAALILHIIPFCLLIRTVKYPLKAQFLYKFQTVERLSIEMAEMNSRNASITDQSSSDEDEEDENELLHGIDNPIKPPTEPTCVQHYYQNFGVNILPNIPEESEQEDEDDINEISSKRLSKISAILQGLNTTKDENNSVNNLYQPDVDIVEKPPEKEIIEVNSPELEHKQTRCFTLSSQTKYNLKHKKKELKDYAKEHFIKPFPRTLSNLYFYPVVISSSVTTTLSTVVLASAPAVMFVDSMNRNKPQTLNEAVFILTIIGFTWIFFLVGYPVFSKLSSIKVKLLFLIGLSISALSLYVVEKFSYDNYTLFSLSFGLGHGIVSYTERIACEDFAGKSNWKILQGPLEITTGFIVIVIYFSIYYLNVEIDVLFAYAYWPYALTVVLWIIAYVSKQIVVSVRKLKRYNREKYPDFNF